METSDGIQPLTLDPLTNGRDDRIDPNDMIAPGHPHRLAPALVVRFRQLRAKALETGHFSVASKGLNRDGQESDLKAFFLGLLDLFNVGGHFAAGSPVNQVHLVASQADQGSSRVDRHIAAAYDRHFWPGLCLFPLVTSLKKAIASIISAGFPK
jgi:hypothetical protein